MLLRNNLITVPFYLNATWFYIKT